MDTYQKYLLELSQRMQSLTDWSAQEMRKLGIDAERIGHKLEYHFYNSSPFYGDALNLRKLYDALNVEQRGVLSATYWKEVEVNQHTYFTIFQDGQKG